MLHLSLHGEDEPAYETQPTCQPRPNVLLELGMVLMAYPARTLIVEIGKLRPIADLAGRNVIRFDGSASAIGKIVERLKQSGCKINDTGTDWRQTWPFKHLDAYLRRP
jgi:predicted nucleotide-binding protein